MCRFNSKQIINHFLNGNILTDFCSKSHELSRVKGHTGMSPRRNFGRGGGKPKGSP